MQEYIITGVHPSDAYYSHREQFKLIGLKVVEHRDVRNSKRVPGYISGWFRVLDSSWDDEPVCFMAVKLEPVKVPTQKEMFSLGE